MSNNMMLIKRDYPELYKNMVELKELVYENNVVDDKTLKLVSIAITAANEDVVATRKQIISGMEEYDITHEEIMDILKVVLLISGKPAFMKAVGIVYEQSAEKP